MEEDDKPALAPSIGTLTVATPIAVGKDEKVAIPAYLDGNDPFSDSGLDEFLDMLPQSPYIDISPLEPPVHPFVTDGTHFREGMDDVIAARRRRALLVSPIDPSPGGEYATTAAGAPYPEYMGTRLTLAPGNVDEMTHLELSNVQMTDDFDEVPSRKPDPEWSNRDGPGQLDVPIPKGKTAPGKTGKKTKRPNTSPVRAPEATTIAARMPLMPMHQLPVAGC